MQPNNKQIAQIHTYDRLHITSPCESGGVKIIKSHFPGVKSTKPNRTDWCSKGTRLQIYIPAAVKERTAALLKAWSQRHLSTTHPFDARPLHFYCRRSVGSSKFRTNQGKQMQRIFTSRNLIFELNFHFNVKDLSLQIGEIKICLINCSNRLFSKIGNLVIDENQCSVFCLIINR